MYYKRSLLSWIAVRMGVLCAMRPVAAEGGGRGAAGCRPAHTPDKTAHLKLEFEGENEVADAEFKAVCISRQGAGNWEMGLGCACWPMAAVSLPLYTRVHEVLSHRPGPECWLLQLQQRRPENVKRIILFL